MFTSKVLNLKAVLLSGILLTLARIPECAGIAGGENAVSANFMVYLKKGSRVVCGGSLLSATDVVTAAHCVDTRKAAALTVVGNTLTTQVGRKRVSKVRLIVKPSAYQRSDLNMDVAVLKLFTPMTGIGTIPLCDVDLEIGDLMQIYGWGKTSEDSNPITQQLQTVEVPVVDQTECADAFVATVTSTMFCTSTEDGKGFCKGDGGGPAVFQNRLCGIISWGNGCADPDFPGVFTDLSIPKTQDFILYAMNNF